MTDATAIKEAAAINEEMLDALLVIYRVGSRAERRGARRAAGSATLAARSMDYWCS
jgi:hypothetical protein